MKGSETWESNQQLTRGSWKTLNPLCEGRVAPTHFKHAEMKGEKLEFKNLNMIQEDVPMDEMNYGDILALFSRRKNTYGLNQVSLSREF